MEGGEMQVTVDLSEGTTGEGAAAQDSVAAVSPEDDGTIEREATDITGLTLPTPPKNFGMIFLAHLLYHRVGNNDKPTVHVYKERFEICKHSQFKPPLATILYHFFSQWYPPSG